MKKGRDRKKKRDSYFGIMMGEGILEQNKNISLPWQKCDK